MTGHLNSDASPNAQRSQAQYPRPQAAPAPPPQPPRQRSDRQEAPPPLGIDPETWPIIQGSAALLARNEGAFIEQLHYEMMTLTRGPAEAQIPGMWVFCERMVRSLLWVALAGQSLGVIADTLRGVGAQNWVDGFPDTLYGDVAHAMVRTVHLLCAHDRSTTTASAWITYFMSIKPHLLAGAEQAADQHAAAQQAAEQEAVARRDAAEREAARVQALSRDPGGGRGQVVGDVNLESVSNLLDDEDDENVGYGQIMLNMTRNSRREPPRRQS
jgi:hypothetical protein